MAALTFGLAPEIRQSSARLVLFVVLYNLGRILTYALAGAAVGGVVAAVGYAMAPEGSQVWLQRAAAVILILIGFYLAGWFPQLNRLERIGVPLWRRIEPLARRIMPARRPWQALAYGAAWGWIPCGMVYTMLIAASAQGGAQAGAVYMVMFGLGTLIPVSVAGILTGQAQQIMRSPALRQVLGIVVILFGTVNLIYPDYIQRLGLAPPSHFQEFCIGPSQ